MDCRYGSSLIASKKETNQQNTKRNSNEENVNGYIQREVTNNITLVEYARVEKRQERVEGEE